MNKFSEAIINHKKTVLVAFLVIAITCAFLTSFVSVNYNMVDYLPEDAQSTVAIKMMASEFGGEMPNARLMLNSVSLEEAIEYKIKIAMVDGVKSINWLDDMVDISSLSNMPVEYLNNPEFKNFYSDNSALMPLSIEHGKESSTVDAIYDIIGDNHALAGEAVMTAETQKMSVTEVLNAMMILLPIIVIILILTTTSWLEPLLFLITIGIAIIINMGTNIIFGEISFITKTVSPILQLAVSMDYAIFLLHSFHEHRNSHEPKDAMKLALKESLPTVAASAATTVIGFAALIFMRFGIGADLGLNLLKGVILSFISVMVFLPALTLLFNKVIEKSKHGKLIPSFKNTGKWFMKIRIPFLILALLVVVPSFIAQSKTKFLYGMSSITSASRVGKDALSIEDRFGKENMLALLVPKGDIIKEAELSTSLAQLPNVNRILSLPVTVGVEIPPEYLPEEILEQFYSANYARIILYTDTEDEGDKAFDLVESTLDTAAKYYDDYYLSGQSATLYDMKNVVSEDNARINLIAIIGIFIVLLLTFRSLILPFCLLFTIETAIWINLSFPYFIGQPISFIGYLIISTVQLGATVDYAILFTSGYLNNRATLSKKDAMTKTIGDNLIAILTSALILATAGFALAFTSGNPIIGELGTLLGRGTLLSLFMVTCVLPALLLLFDAAIHKTTWKSKVLKTNNDSVQVEK